MNRKGIIFLAAIAANIFIAVSLPAQTVDLEEVATLPLVVREASTLETPDGKIFWSLNDGGNKAAVYAVDIDTNLLDSFDLPGIDNVDFESMAFDDENGFIFIGDVGDNSNVRDTLVIYKISGGGDSIGEGLRIESIRFVYPDKGTLAPGEKHCAFDCEAMFHFKHHLYLFSKNRCKPKYSKCYRLPDQPGNFKAELVDSIELPTWVTSADISPDEKTVALLSETRLYLFTEFEGDHFLQGKLQSFFLGVPSQKEGVVFGDEDTIFISDERWTLTGGKIYRVELAEFLK